jgi:hypothetical protein
MTITNKAVGEQVNLATVLNTKLEAPILQSEMGLNTVASATGDAVRWDEFSLKHNNDGTFKGIGNADISSTASIVSSKLAIQKNYKKSSVANPSATANTDGTIVDLLPITGYVALNPLFFNVVFGGTFGAETVTSTISVAYSDTTTTSITKTATAVGTTSLTGTDLMGLIKDGVYINKISVKSKSSISSSTVTVTFNHAGLYL